MHVSVPPRSFHELLEGRELTRSPNAVHNLPTLKHEQCWVCFDPIFVTQIYEKDSDKGGVPERLGLAALVDEFPDIFQSRTSMESRITSLKAGIILGSCLVPPSNNLVRRIQMYSRFFG